MWEIFFLWAFGKLLQKVCKIIESTKFGNIICGVCCNNMWGLLYNERSVGDLEVPNISRTKDACCHAVQHLTVPFVRTNFTVRYHCW